MRHIPGGAFTALPFEEAWAQAQTFQKDYDVEKWLYVPPAYGEYRYILGTRGKRPLICVGINPSTAAPDRLDPTLKSVLRTALDAGYDSFLMFNLYAQRATDPDGMEKEFNEELHAQNMAAFARVLSLFETPPDLWAAWGAIIEKRAYLFRCAADMAKIAQKAGARWYTCGKRSVKGHPHHPLYLKRGSMPEPFDVFAYLESVSPDAGGKE